MCVREREEAGELELKYTMETLAVARSASTAGRSACREVFGSRSGSGFDWVRRILVRSPFLRLAAKCNILHLKFCSVEDFGKPSHESPSLQRSSLIQTLNEGSQSREGRA